MQKINSKLKDRPVDQPKVDPKNSLEPKIKDYSKELDLTDKENHHPQEEQKVEKKSTFINTAIKDKDKQSTVYHRYYHVFREGELEALILKYFKDKLAIESKYYDHANWVVVCRKLP